MAKGRSERTMSHEGTKDTKRTGDGTAKDAKAGTELKSSKAEEFKGCGLKKCPFRKADRNRIAWNGKVKGDTIRRHRRQMGDGRQLFAEMPRGAFFVEDRSRRRIIFAGELIRGEGRGARGEGGMQTGRFGVLYRELEHGDGSHLLRRKGAETRATLSEAMEDLWRWARGKQGPGMVIVEGEVE